MLKNPTPRHIALLSSLIIFSVGTVLVVLTELNQWGQLNGLKYLLASAVFLIVSYSVLIYYLRSYIYRKIKLIYKTIHNEKLAPGEKERQKKININSNVMDEVDQEVAAWAENQQREIDKYKSWAEYRRNFLGDISHELKTPIFNIQGYLESLLDGGLQDESVNLIFLQKAVKNVERLQIIIHDLETISRLESGEMLLEMQSFDIRELAKEVFEEIEIKAAERNITLDLKEGASQPFRVKADREKIRQVLINLVHNSVKYGVPNGRTKIAFYDMDKHVLIEVADNGIGIPRQHLAHVFDRFYRVDKSRSRAQGGSGLGLSIVKHTIEAHKQTINVRSSPSLGSTFGFTLDKA
jgi:two-component system phosphate regulon sensor histidine kinase PhoR